MSYPSTEVRTTEEKGKDGGKRPPEAEATSLWPKAVGAKFREVVTVQPVRGSPRPHVVGSRGGTWVMPQDCLQLK